MNIHIPDQFNFEQSEEYILSIRLEPDGFSFSIQDSTAPEKFFFHRVLLNKTLSYEENFKEFFFANEFLSAQYKKVRIISCSKQYTLVPYEAMREGAETIYYSFCFDDDERVVLRNSLKELNLEIVFSLPAGLYEFCSRSFLAPQYIHHIAPEIRSTEKSSVNSDRKQLSVFIDGKMLDVVSMHKRELQFANSYSFDQLQDILYFITNVWKQQAMDQVNDELLIHAPNAVRVRLKEVLKVYFKNIRDIQTPSEHFFATKGFPNLPYDIQTLSLCE